MLVKFDSGRLERMFKRWMAKPQFADKEPLLRSAIKSFTNGDAVPVLKIVLTEIEGILNEAYRKVHGQSAKLKALLAFAVALPKPRPAGPTPSCFPQPSLNIFNNTPSPTSILPRRPDRPGHAMPSTMVTRQPRPTQCCVHCRPF